MAHDGERFQIMMDYDQANPIKGMFSLERFFLPTSIMRMGAFNCCTSISCRLAERKVKDDERQRVCLVWSRPRKADRHPWYIFFVRKKRLSWEIPCQKKKRTASYDIEPFFSGSGGVHHVANFARSGVKHSYFPRAEHRMFRDVTSRASTDLLAIWARWKIAS